MRLINEDEARQQIDEWLDTVGTVYIGHGLSYYAELMGCLEDCKTIDPVKHGRWLLERDEDGIAVCFHCSVCDNDEHYTGVYNATPYCPNCGSRMDGGTT